MSSSPDHEAFAKQRAATAAANPALKTVPNRYKSFAQAFVGKVAVEAPTIDLANRARPEELAFWKEHGWDGVSPLPADAAQKMAALKAQRGQIAREIGVDIATKEELLAKLEQSKSVSVDDLTITPIEDIDTETPEGFRVIEGIEHIQSDDSQSVFAQITSPDNKEKLHRIMAEVDGQVSPKVYDSRNKPKAVTAPPPLPTAPTRELPPAHKPVPAPPVKPQLPPTRQQVPVPPPPPPPPVATATPPPAGNPPNQTTGDNKLIICPRCKLDLDKPYLVKPEQKDVEIRQLSIGQRIQGGDGRFRRIYSLFGGQIILEFRELLASETKLIWDAEASPLYKPTQPGLEAVAFNFSVDRVVTRRHFCGLEACTYKGQERVELPPIADWVSMANEREEGDPVNAAFAALEAYVRANCYGTESVLMAAGRAWNHFEDLVTALWNDQTFYSGTP